jgi:hypothetical protein
MKTMVEQKTTYDNLTTEYKEVCNNFRLLTDIRFKLLALLPIATGIGVALSASGRSGINTSLVGLFGLVVTASAALYNLRNDQLYNALVGRAAHLERLLGLKDGAFAQRPRPWRRAGPFKVNHEKIRWIYLASLAAWLYTILFGLNVLLPPEWPPQPAQLIKAGGAIQLIEAGGAIVLMLLIAWSIQFQEQRTRKKLRAAARGGVKELTETLLSLLQKDPNLRSRLLDRASVLAGRNREDVEKQLTFYLGHPDSIIYWDQPPADQSCDERAAAQLLSLVSDMPSGWIFDVASRRREPRASPPHSAGAAVLSPSRCTPESVALVLASRTRKPVRSRSR